MTLHYAGCPLWSDDWGRCSCPRPWRIVRDRIAPGRQPWLVLHWEADGKYHLLVRTLTWARAMRLVDQLIVFDRTFT